MKHPDPPSDRDIHEAFHALDGTIPDGHLDDFLTRVLARLDEPEVSGMDSRELARGSGLNRPENAEAALAADATAHEAGVTPKREEHSGLHEIKALASTTRRRISQRMSSDSEAEESLLVGATSGSFRAAAAALPDPTHEKGAAGAEPASDRGRDRLARPGARPADLDRRPAPSRSSSAPFWMLGGVATAAAATAVAVFVFGVGREKKDVASPSSPTGEVIAQATGAAASSDEPTAGSAAPGDMRFAEPPPAEQPAPGAAPAATSAPAVAALDSAPEKKASEEQGDGEGGLKGRGAAGGRVDSKTEHASDKADPEREKREESKDGDKNKEKDLKKAAPTSGAKGGGGKDLNDVLDEVTGGIQKPAAPTPEEGAKKPSKKSLDRRDVAKAMGAVRSQVMRCRDKEQYEGTVTVKFHVAPSGQVTSAETTGSKAGSSTGACAAAAVKKAVFPAFDGAPTSFTYPFLLAE